VSGQLGALERLDIRGCSNLRSLDSLVDLPSLESIAIVRCNWWSWKLLSSSGSHGEILPSHRYEATLQTQPTAA